MAHAASTRTSIQTKLRDLLQDKPFFVSSRDPTSVDKSLCHGHVDKLCLWITAKIPVPTLVKRAERVGVVLKKGKLRSYRFCLFVPGSGLYFELHGFIDGDNFDRAYVKNIISRPSAYESYRDYEDHLALFVSRDELTSAKITRIDLAVDLPYRLLKVLRGLDVAFKRRVDTYHDDGGVRTGVSFGRGTQRLSVYDRRKRLKRGRVCTRIELQLRGKHVRGTNGTLNPVHWLAALFRQSQSVFDEPFKHVTLGDVRLRISRRKIDEPTLQKLLRINAIIGLEGYCAARKRLNANRNFRRDYGALIERELWTVQLDELLRTSLEPFFATR